MKVSEAGVGLNAAPQAERVRRDEMGSGNDARELLNALAGKEADRDRAVTQRTRRVVLGSLGVVREQRANKSRARAVALAVTILVLLLIAPLVWEVTDSFIAGEHLGDPGNQWSLLAIIVCPTLLGAVMIAGWWRKRG